MEHLLTPVVTRCLDNLFPLIEIVVSIVSLLHNLNVNVTVRCSFLKSCV